MSFREIGIKALSSVLNNKKNCETFEKLIYDKVSNNKEFYIWSVYQVCGFLLKDKGEMKIVAKNIKKGKIGWNAVCYDETRQKIEEFDEYLIKPFEVVEGVVQCLKCQSKKTWSVQKQTRSSDEPMTTFSKCVDCGHQWSYAG
jgi:DNA-directed RNA polymerase subunit M/transcription elongation factor TFIIS